MKENVDFFYLLIEIDFLDTRSYFLAANQNTRLTTHNRSKFEWCHSRIFILSSKLLTNESACTIPIIL